MLLRASSKAQRVKRKPILPPTVFLIAILAMVALHFLLPITKAIRWPYASLGIPFILVGILLNLWSSNLFTKSATTVNPFETSSRLVTEGPYRLSRHPMYLGMTMILAGLSALLGTVTPMLIIPTFACLIDRKFITPEEKAMEQTFPNAWQQYKNQTRRWI